LIRPVKPANPFSWIKARSVMRTTTVRRRFTLMDAVVLIAATAVSLVPVRLYLEGPWPPPLTLDDWSLGSLWTSAAALSRLLSPFAVGLCLALPLLRVTEARPEWRRVMAQPGMVACIATVMATVLLLLKIVITHYYYHQSKWGPPVPTIGPFLLRSPWNGEVVAVAWTILWLSGSWRPVSNWIDRTGRLLGIYWVTDSLFFALPIVV
jgi:hypothetical protein